MSRGTLLAVERLGVRERPCMEALLDIEHLGVSESLGIKVRLNTRGNSMTCNRLPAAKHLSISKRPRTGVFCMVVKHLDLY